MKKKMISLLLLCCLLASGGIGFAREADFGTAVIDAKTSDRVHFRREASAESKSLGLYFTGTEVLCNSSPYEQWTQVTIGSQMGFIKSEFLVFGENLGRTASKQPSGFVDSKNATGKINLRSGPSQNASIEGKFSHGEPLILMGETADHWCYIEIGGLQGYMMAEYVSIGKSAPPKPVPPKPEPVPEPNPQPSKLGYEMLTHSPSPGIKIQYPRFLGGNTETINALVSAKLQGIIDAHLVDPSLAIMYQAAVTLLNDKVVSMIFWGSSNVTGSAHPSTALFSFNVDLATMREIRLEDLYLVNADFEKMFFEKAYFPSAPVTSYDAGRFAEMLRQQGPEYEPVSPFSYTGGVACFLKPDGLVLTMPAVHATGSDHFEAQLRYEDVAAFYQPAGRYW